MRKVLANLYQHGGHFLWDSSSSVGRKEQRWPLNHSKKTKEMIERFTGALSLLLTRERRWRTKVAYVQTFLSVSPGIPPLKGRQEV